MENKKYVPKKELTAFCVAGLGQGMIYALMSSYISDYYLNVLQLTPMFVLLLMLLARVWDAINDPLMGMIVDRSNLKSGKMISFIRFALVPIAAVTLLMYLSPNLPKTELMIYSAIVYVAWRSRGRCSATPGRLSRLVAARSCCARVRRHPPPR